MPFDPLLQYGGQETRSCPLFRSKKLYENMRSLIIWLGLAELAMSLLIRGWPVGT